MSKGNACLRPLQRNELEKVLTWRNHPDVRRFMYTQHIISLEEHRNWFDKNCLEENKHLLIYECNGEASGFVNLTLADTLARRADWGFYLSPQAPRGSGKRLGRLTLSYAFENICVHKICGEALAYNSRSIKFHERLGFRQEACLREHHFDGTSYHDVVVFGLLYNEWNSLQGVGFYEDV